jgi:hypothetical protein
LALRQRSVGRDPTKGDAAAARQSVRQRLGGNSVCIWAGVGAATQRGEFGGRSSHRNPRIQGPKWKAIKV